MAGEPSCVLLAFAGIRVASERRDDNHNGWFTRWSMGAYDLANKNWLRTYSTDTLPCQQIDCLTYFHVIDQSFRTVFLGEVLCMRVSIGVCTSVQLVAGGQSRTCIPLSGTAAIN